jgi:peptide/nickel transport system substrate-binding protein
VENPGPAYLERIELLVIPEAMTRVMEFEDRVRKGEAVYTTAIPTGDVLRLKADPAIQAITTPTTGAEMIWINTTIWPFDDIRVREALIHSIDAKTIIEYVRDGLAIPAITHLSPAQIGYEHAIGPIKPVVREFDPERARELFAEAGWLPGPDGILVHQETGRRAEFGLLAHTGHIGEPEVIKAQLREVGLDIRITILEPAASVAKAREGVYELYLIAYGWPDVLRPLFYFHTDMIGGLNFAFFKNPQYDELVDIAHTALDPEVRHRATNEALVLVMDQAIYVPMWHAKLFAMATAGVVGGMELLGAHPGWSLDIFALDLHIR